MTTAADLRALAEECTKLKEGASKLDDAIAAAVGFGGSPAPQWTSSLDAAMQLKPERWRLKLREADEWSATLWTLENLPRITVRAATAPLAIVAASLLARAA